MTKAWVRRAFRFFATASQARIGIGLALCLGLLSSQAQAQTDPVLRPFNPTPNQEVQAALEVDGQYWLGGKFTVINSTAQRYLARINADGTLDPGFSLALNGEVSVLVRHGAYIYVGGSFTKVRGQDRPLIFRLRLDGTLDTSFQALPTSLSSPWNVVNDILVQPDGKIVLSGRIIVDDNTSNLLRLIRMHPNGSRDTGFNPPTISGPGAYSMAWQASSGKLLVVTPHPPRLIRLEADGTQDANFNPPHIDNHIHRVRVDQHGRILMAGRMSMIGSDWRVRMARLNADGSFDASFQNPGIGGAHVNDFAWRPDGTLLVVGQFSNIATPIGGPPPTPHRNMALLNGDGSVVSSFGNANITGDAEPEALRVLSLEEGTRALVVGRFTEAGGQARNHVALFEIPLIETVIFENGFE